MPPRKSAASTVSGAEANGDVSTLSTATNATASSSTQHAHPKSSRQSGGGSGRQDDGVGIDDLLLPRSLVSRLSRGVLPPNTSLQKDALLALTRSATVFISYLAHHANEQSQLRHKKTLGVQDVMAALKEIEFGNVMDLGAVGKDGRTGGRLEREVEVYEEIIGRKRRGYREKVKARESGGAEGDGDAEDRGEPSNKKIRRMSAEEEDEEERMLEQQLNGTTGEEAPSAEKGKVKRKSSDKDGISVVVRNGKGKGKPDSNPEEAEGQVDVGGDEDVEEADDGADEDEQEEDEEEEEDDQEEDEDEEQDDEDDEAAPPHDDDDNVDDVDDSRLANGRANGRVGLLPDGNVEIGSEDESD